ncbi:MAG: tetratricopeptide repeat protein [Acidobacteria bacterium]|nr:tetratricopeptide repeat protein [Acidobacteriota bacterium]MCI0623095.1 tetratricopeptide repeat protein [Acidobacteriota bacterium]MCI0723607.1 tetratricopeptide repeat protein [Acidobacteriota bacterium]
MIHKPKTSSAGTRVTATYQAFQSGRHAAVSVRWLGTAVRRCAAVSLLLCLIFGPPAAADIIHFKNGKKLNVERAWEEGGRIHYERNGNVFGFSKELVARIESGAYLPDAREAPPKATREGQSVPIEVLDEALDLDDSLDSEAPEVIRDGQLDQNRLRAIENDALLQPGDAQRKLRYQKALRDVIQWQIKRNDLASALSFIGPYLRLDPDNLQANLTLGWLHIKRGQYPQAENVLLKSRIRNDQSAELHYLLGMTYYHQDKNELASRELRQSLELRYRLEVDSLLKKIEQENQAENEFKQANSLHFVVRYEGSETNQALGQGILASLERSFTELENQLNYSPRDSIAVVLYPDEVFQDVTKMPGWVGALNDGKIRFPIKGLTFVDDTVRSILKHELTHSFIRLKTAGNCPLWLNEGLAQYLSGDSSRSFLPLAKQAIAQKSFPDLSQLEGPFIGMDAGRAAWAYQESLLATEFLMKAYGLSDVQKLLENIGKTGNFVTGLRTALRREYAELQREFEEYVQRQ